MAAKKQEGTSIYNSQERSRSPMKISVCLAKTLANMRKAKPVPDMLPVDHLNRANTLVELYLA